MAYTTIKKPSDYFNTKLYTGTGASNSITGVGFQPDWVWMKNRSVSGSHQLLDIVRGASKTIYSNRDIAEETLGDGLTSFDSDGFTISSSPEINGSGNNIVSWNWLASNTTASNTDGDITSTVSANTTSGFSIVKWTGTGSSGTIGHGLGVAPKVVIVKRYSSAADWVYYTTTIDGSMDYLYLNLTNAKVDSGNPVPTSSVFQKNDTNGETQIAYCFAEKQGFSKFGSYIGNGTSGVDGAGDGTFVYTGFKPGMIIIKPSSAVENWQILDNKRPGFNESDNLAPNNNATENTSNDFVDLVSNGFKLRSGTYSASGVTYIYMAFAEEPLVGDNPATAR